MMNMDYKYTGNYTDWDGAKNSKQKSVDIVNLTLSKKKYLKIQFPLILKIYSINTMKNQQLMVRMEEE